MKTIVPRTCTVVPPGTEKRIQVSVSRPLSEFRDAPAYVLLGDPGSGKTTAFKTECEALGEEACKVDARDFLELSMMKHPEWRGKTLFIDGLDEVRAGVADVRKPFDRLRNRLEKLGRPRFRLSCREADWLGDNDGSRLETVSPDTRVTVLRLDPLTEAETVSILENKGIEDPQAFMENARERRIDGLLQNPLTLEFLATIITRSKQWPESRRETFEKACLQLVSEHNQEHEAAKQPRETDELMDAAGRLCAVQLISGIKGYMQSTGDRDSDFPSLTEIQYENPELRQSVLSTKLFKAESGSLNRFGPIHRHVAEYLGARYLARLIEDGLPVRRILSLITGADGIVVTGLRGLSAWLAAHCKGARRVLIKQDPVGVGLYGDIRMFSPDERQALMETLSCDVYRLGSIQTAPAFGPLATPEMEPFLSATLSHGSRTDEHQMFVSFVLRFLREGSRLRGLSGLLFDIVRDESRSPGINELALNAFIHCEDEKTANSELKKLLTEIQNGIVSDPDHELIGILLWHLYPRELPPMEVWDYLWSASDQSSLIGYYKLFWSIGLVRRSDDEQVVALLNALRERRFGSGTDQVKVHPYEDFPLRLLARGLQVQGDQLDTQHLYDWLDSGLAADPDRDDSVTEIRTWLEKRPQIQKKVIIEGLNRCPQSDEFRYNAFDVQKRLFGAVLPSDFGMWCLKQAMKLAATKTRIADHLLELAWQSFTYGRGDKGLSLELLKRHSKKNVELMNAYLCQLRAPSSNPRFGRVEDRGDSQSQYTDHRTLRDKQWFDKIRSSETALRENRAPHKLLSSIAGRYFGASISRPIAGGEREIERDLGSDQGLINAVRLGIRGVIIREDVPSVEDILTLMKKSQAYHISWPFLAALEEIEKSAPHEITQLNKVQMCKALAFHFCVGYWHEPKWYQRIRDARPDVVAEMLIRCGTLELRRRDSGNSGLFAWLPGKENAKVATIASLPLLRAVPTRCKAAQNHTLDNLLWAALRHADRKLLGELIESKLATTSMNVGQRVRWLAAAAILSPETYIEHLTEYLGVQENRIRHLVGFMPDVIPSVGLSLADVELEIDVLEVFVRLISVHVGPHQKWNNITDDDEGDIVGPEMQAAWLVDGLIQRLAGIPEDAARNALVDLLEDERLPAWRDVLSRARDSQRVIQRDASYRHPEPEQVCRTLDSGSPANAADLAALLVDRLDEISSQIETGNTDDWRQYWNEDSYGRPCKPKAENSCRDALLSDLRQRLPGNVDAQPEGQYARDKRADIRVSSGQEFQVPVEIKKNNHPDLWNAIRTQLIAKYTREPAAAGQGIYLVFWFGEEDTQPDPSGTRPGIPGELRAGLEATLSDEEARRISVCVIDVSGK